MTERGIQTNTEATDNMAGEFLRHLVLFGVVSRAWAQRTCLEGDCVNGFGKLQLSIGKVYEGKTSRENDEVCKF